MKPKSTLTPGASIFLQPVAGNVIVNVGVNVDGVTLPAAGTAAGNEVTFFFFGAFLSGFAD
ncbi:MAG TPA: hypothetical protein VH986_10755 [Acidimicrobiia bacterium]